MLNTILCFPSGSLWEKIRKNSGQFRCTVRTKEDICNDLKGCFNHNIPQQPAKNILGNFSGATVRSSQVVPHKKKRKRFCMALIACNILITENRACLKMKEIHLVISANLTEQHFSPLYILQYFV